MTDNLRPTRAEATDVANAVLDGPTIFVYTIWSVSIYLQLLERKAGKMAETCFASFADYSLLRQLTIPIHTMYLDHGKKPHRLHTRRMQRRENNVQSFEKLRQVRRNLEQAKSLLEVVDGKRRLTLHLFETVVFKFEVLDHKAREKAGIITPTLGAPIPVLLTFDATVGVGKVCLLTGHPTRFDPLWRLQNFNPTKRERYPE